jgi:NitT/TauT family transport system substrate-binding protein
MLKYGLHLKDVQWERIEVVNAGGPDLMAAAFREGNGDYVHLQGPAPQQLEKAGMGCIVASIGEVIPPIAFSSLMARREFLTTSKARSFLNAYRRSLKFVIESDPSAVSAGLSSFFPDVSLDVLASAIARYQKLGCWRPDPSITREQYELAMDVFVQTGVFQDRYAYEDVVVPTPV